MPARLIVSRYNNVSNVFLGEQHVEINEETLYDHPIFEVFEYEKVAITASGYIENLRILIETAGSEYLVELPKHEEKCISEGNEESSIFVPGDYGIHIIYQNESVERYYFRVVSNRIDWNGLIAIREELERFQEGLSYDLADRKRAVYNLGAESAARNIISRIDFIVSSKDKIIGTINQLINLQYTEATKSYKINEHVKKVDAKSIKWLTTKGMSVNNDPNRPEIILQPKNTPAIINEFNISLKNQIEYWNYEIIEIKSQLGSTLKSLKVKIDSLNKEVEIRKSKITELDSQGFVSEKSRFRIKNETSRYLEENILLTKRYEDLMKMQQNIDNISNALNQLLRNTWINSLPTKNDSKIASVSKQSRLYPILSIRKNYEDMIAAVVTNEPKVKSEQYYKSKKTSELYELYVLLTCIKIVTSLGYKMDERFLDLIYGINSGQSFLFIGDEGLCKISYDREIKRNNYDFENDDYCYINGTHNRPDIIIGFYKYDAIIPYKSIIVEVKCANVRRIFSEIEDTDIMLQVKDYFNFGFYDSVAEKTKRAVIDKVIVVHPYPAERLTNIMENSIVSISLYPKENIIMGYDYLLKELVN
jgi:hypothetical protein